LRGGDAESTYGFDVAGYVGAVGYDTAVAALPGQVRAELLKDDRVADVAVSAARVTDAAGSSAITISAHVVLVDSGESFDLTVSATDVTLTLLGVS
jgi:hypothetical protein